MKAQRAQDALPISVLYLTFFEPVINNGIHETQVKQLLCQLGSSQGLGLKLAYCAFLPAVEVGRTEVLAPFATDRKKLETLRHDLAACNVDVSIVSLPLALPKRWVADPPFPVLALAVGLALPVVVYRIARNRPAIVHCRSYVATLLAVLAKMIFPHLKVVFDPRGFWPEEGVVGGKWKATSLKFKFWKYVEQKLLLHSDKVIALSQPFADRIKFLTKQADCQVIFTCSDTQTFDTARQSRESRRAGLGLVGKTVFAYNGSLSAWHDPALLARIYKAISLSFPGAFLLVITGHGQKRLKEIFETERLNPSQYLIVAAKASEVPEYLAAADYGLVPLKALESDAMSVVTDTMIGTKVAEYLAAGLPIIVNQNVGGLRPLMKRHKVGVLFDSENMPAMIESIGHVQANYPQYRANCMLLARDCFSLEQIARSYFATYREMVAPESLRDPELAVASSSSTPVS